MATVRACFLAYLAQRPRFAPANDDADDPPEIESESILIRDEFYCGRRFRAAAFHAIWFIEEDQLKIYHAGGSLAVVLSSDQITSMAEPGVSTETADSEPMVFKLPTPPESAAEITQDSSEASSEVRRAA